MTSAIVLRNLRKTYRRGIASKPFEALRGVDLDIPQGEVFGFIGPNGAGKSTAIKILIGVIKPSDGQASLFGLDVGSAVARKGLGYVPENPSLPDYLTPLEILKMGLRLHKIRVEDETRHCTSWLDRFGLLQVAGKPVRNFSKGMAQRTALAHAMAVKPRLLILDEPLSGLDPIGRSDVVDILSGYRREGGTIFLTSHVLHDIERLADRFGLIHKGELKALNSPGELASAGETVVIRSLGENAVLAEMSSEPGGRWRVEIPREKLWVLLDQLKHANHKIVEVRPTLSLESVFMNLVSQDTTSRIL